MFKRMLRTALSLLLIASILIASASASVVRNSPTPRYTYINTIMAGLGINNGIATVSGSVSAGLVASKIVVRLQREDPEGWVTIKTWHDSNDNGPSSTEGTFALIKTNYDYRTQVIGTIYSSSGDLLESEIMYSDIRHY